MDILRPRMYKLEHRSHEDYNSLVLRLCPRIRLFISCNHQTIPVALEIIVHNIIAMISLAP